MARKQDPAWLAAQYNNRARVPDHAEILARWARDSQAIRDTRPCQLDLAYGDTPAERLDVFRPSDAARDPKARRRPGAPMLVFIHGGYWRSLDKDDFSFIAPAFNAAGATGRVSAGFAPGMPPAADLAAMEEAVKQGIVVVQSSRAGSGRIYRSQKLAKAGVLAAVTAWNRELGPLTGRTRPARAGPAKGGIT